MLPNYFKRKILKSPGALQLLDRIISQPTEHGVTLMWILLLSDHSVRGRVAPMNAGLVSNNQNISVSSRYYNNLTMGILPLSPRNSHDMLALDANIVNHWAAIQSRGMYDNVLATLNVYGEAVKDNQISEAAVTLSSGADSGGPIEAVQFGWHVWPARYGDFDTHFFISWTVDGYHNTGCFNLDCPGFVFNDESQYRPGNKLKPVSERNGKQYEIIIRLHRNKVGYWYLFSGIEWDKPIGYWKSELFVGLFNGGDRIDVGGYVQYTKGEPGPPMGSGFSPSDPNGKAAYIRATYVKDHSETVTLPGSIHVDRGDCYSLARSNGDYLYGGPGGCTD